MTRIVSWVTIALGFAVAYSIPILTAHFGGTVRQGEFASIKSEIDLLNNFFIFGLSQSIVLALNRGLTNIRTLYPIVMKYSVFCLAASFALLVIWRSFEGENGADWQRSALLALSICGIVFANLARGVVLTVNDGVPFALFSIFPQIMLMASCLLVLVHSNLVFEQAFAVQGLACILLSFAVLHKIRSLQSETGHQFPRIAPLVQENVLQVLTSLAMNLMPVLTFQIIRRYGASNGEIGIASIIILPTQILSALSAVFAPNILNDTSKRGQTAIYRRGPVAALYHHFPVLVFWSAILQACALLCVPFTNFVLTTLLGQEFSAAVSGLQLMAMGVFPSIVTRGYHPKLLANGKHYQFTSVALMRLFISLLGLGFILNAKAGFAIAVAASWTFAEWAAMLTLWIGLARSPAVRPLS